MERCSKRPGLGTTGETLHQIKQSLAAAKVSRYQDAPI